MTSSTQEDWETEFDNFSVAYSLSQIKVFIRTLLASRQQAMVERLEGLKLKENGKFDYSTEIAKWNNQAIDAAIAAVKEGR